MQAVAEGRQGQEGHRCIALARPPLLRSSASPPPPFPAPLASSSIPCSLATASTRFEQCLKLIQTDLSRFRSYPSAPRWRSRGILFILLLSRDLSDRASGAGSLESFEELNCLPSIAGDSGKNFQAVKILQTFRFLCYKIFWRRDTRVLASKCSFSKNFSSKLVHYDC